jgi:hypothetical protein
METQKRESLQKLSAIREPKKPPQEKVPDVGVDLKVERRPGYASYRGIKPWPNSRPDIAQQPRRIPVFMHGRPNKTFPPVFGTDVPPKGLSGWVRRLAYAYPDHLARHWLMLMAADRVDSLEYRARVMLPFAVPVAFLGLAALAFQKRR